MKIRISLILALVFSLALALACADMPSVGDTLFYGSYEQDNNFDNGKEPVEWTVLAVEDGKALLLTRYGIDARYYHPGERETSYPGWRLSDMRKWISGEFTDTLFTTEEQEALVTVTLQNPPYKINIGCQDTEDRVFLLSRAEVEQYLPDVESRLCLPTAYTKTRNVWLSKEYSLNGEPLVWWWLRTAGYYRSSAATVRTVGTITSNRVYDRGGAIRPAIWLDIEKAGL